MTQKILIAKVVSVFGIKGEVKMLVFSNDPTKLENYELFDEAGNEIKLTIRNKKNPQIGSSNGNPLIIAKLDGINDRNGAENLRGFEIFTERKNFGATKQNEFYYVDLIGMDVIDSAAKKIGKVINVFDHGAGGVLEIEFFEADLKNNRDKIENFPFKNQIFPEVNLEKNFVRIEFPEIVKID